MTYVVEEPKPHNVCYGAMILKQIGFFIGLGH